MRYSFAGCALDTDSYVFQRRGVRIPVEPQVFELLRLLAENAGTLVTKDQMIAAVWDGRAVSDATISARVNAARKTVGDTGKAQAIIRTIPRRGIELIAPVINDEPSVVTHRPNDRQQTIRFTRSADGTRLAYAISGSGPGLMRAGHFLTHLEKDWSSPVWGPYLEALSRNHTLVRYDQRGTGLSDPELLDMSVEAYADDLLAVADAAGLERFPLIASSQGVPIAICFAARHPERVSRLVFYGGFVQGRAIREHAHAEEQASALLAMLRAGWGKPGSAFITAFTSIFCPQASREERDHLIEIQLASTTPDNAARIRIAIDRFDVSRYLSEIRAPTLVIHASNDALHPISQGRLIAASIPNAEFLQVESNNHIYLPSDPSWKEIVQAQLQFIERNGRAS